MKLRISPPGVSPFSEDISGLELASEGSVMAKEPPMRMGNSLLDAALEIFAPQTISEAIPFPAGIISKGAKRAAKLAGKVSNPYSIFNPAPVKKGILENRSRNLSEMLSRLIKEKVLPAIKNRPVAPDKIEGIAGPTPAVEVPTELWVEIMDEVADAKKRIQQMLDTGMMSPEQAIGKVRDGFFTRLRGLIERSNDEFKRGLD